MPNRPPTRPSAKALPRSRAVFSATRFRTLVANFREFNRPSLASKTSFSTTTDRLVSVPTFTNEFWTARQRQANSLHEVSYRACFKPQLPRFFIERLTRPGDVVYDPFMGRGTTPIEAGLLGRIPWGNDINPLSLTLTQPRLRPPTIEQLETRIGRIDFSDHDEFPRELLVFYHPETLREICALKKFFKREPTDAVNQWLCMVALNRLTGHSPGFFSVYTLPPNQAVSITAQKRINSQRRQTPPRRDVAQLLLKKSRQLLRDMTLKIRRNLESSAQAARFVNCPAASTRRLPANSVSLIVTSPPFLDVVQYADDNWLRCWFLGIDPKAVALTVPRRVDDWTIAMSEVLREQHRLLKPGGYVAFEVGEIHAGRTKLEEHVLPCGRAAGLKPVLVLINQQRFTKTANCWGVTNMSHGTNTNRIVLFRK